MPIRPVIRDDTVTKKKPKITIRTAASTLPCVGRPGADDQEDRQQQRPARARPSSACHVRSGAALPRRRRPPKSLTLPRNDDTIVGIVRASVMNPAASTAPAPM